VGALGWGAVASAQLDPRAPLPPGTKVRILDGLSAEHWRRLSSPTMNYAESFLRQEVVDPYFTLAFFNELIFEVPEDESLELVELSVEVFPLGLESYIDLMVRRRVNSYYCFRASVPPELPSALIRYEKGCAARIQRSAIALREGEWSRVSLRAKGDQLTCFVDGRRCGSWLDPTLFDGHFGLRAGFLPETLIRSIQIVMRNRSTGEQIVYRDLW